MTGVHFPSLDTPGLTLVAGLGDTGAAVVRWCRRHGVALRLADTRPHPPALDALAASGRLPEARLGPDALLPQALDGASRLVLSPGLSPQDAGVAALLKAAGQAGIEVVGEMELFARALADMAGQDYRPRVLAITGTNGKTTVTALTRRLAQAAGWHAVAAGNIAPAALAALDEALLSGRLPEVWVLELSSFQLATTRSLKADAAAVLNISADHLDWHGSQAAYVRAKAGLLAQARRRIVNRDDPVVRAMVDRLDAADVLSFGADRPPFAGHWGLERRAGQDWLCMAGDGADGKPLMPAAALRLRGRHNALNALAALALVRDLCAEPAALVPALRDYEGEPHRMAFVRQVAGVDFINDSKGTNVGATLAALQGLDTPVVLIAGGLAKGQDFAPLARMAAEKQLRVVLMGRDAPLLAAALGAAGVDSVQAGSLDDAVRRAWDMARPGDTVLLSPACASMDMFRNYQQRGACFGDAVRDLALDQGEVA